MKSPPTIENSELKKNLRIACDALLDKKAMDIKLLYFGESSPLTDCFVVATGNSNPHLKALRDNVEKTLKENKIELFSKDRFQPSGWLVIDAIDFVVHLFSQEQRENYAIEQLWKDAVDLTVEDL
ncbi:MAG: ribosome silencing factor [Opitutae bacterium]|nr:ribosome silencing factor [Opitutae bacterium]|tara:strand:- start:2319 stop:2693 length:375 start_codon:yes stop_codon:yes gene_type:complete